MQFSKDTFYIALRDRLAALNPARTVLLNGATRPAVIVAENEHITSAGPLPEAFYIRWGTTRVVEAMRSALHPLMAFDCTISYWTSGTAAYQGLDRGRLLAQLDSELLKICEPPFAPKLDYTQNPPADLGTNVIWDTPQLVFAETQNAAPLRNRAELPQWNPNPNPPPALALNASLIRLQRAAALTVYFYPEM